MKVPLPNNEISKGKCILKIRIYLQKSIIRTPPAFIVQMIRAGREPETKKIKIKSGFTSNIKKYKHCFKK